MTDWTAAQLAAITEKDARLLVAAAAGAGKTAVLVERIVRRITDPADPVEVDQLLVVTFTNLAAAQMRHRIGTALAGRLAAQPSAKTRRQLLLLNMASINTLHSFCLDLVRSHYYRLGLTPGFRVAGEDEVVAIRRQVMDNLMERCYDSADPRFLMLVDDYGGEKGDDRLWTLVGQLYDFSLSHPDPAAWLAGAAASFTSREGMGPDDFAWSGTVREAIGLALTGAREYLVHALRLAESAGGPGVYADALARDLEMLDSLQKNMDQPWMVLRQDFRGADWGRLPACRSSAVVNEDVKERVRSLRDKAKDGLREVRDRFFAREPEEIVSDHLTLAPRMATLVDLVAEFAAGYREAKLARGLVDFGDLEHFALDLLSQPGLGGAPSALALTYQSRYAEVLVDEYQDINPVQEAILRLVSRPLNASPSLFMVGDVKQSIYRFRLAEPRLFLEKYQSYATHPGEVERRIDLPANFRSRPEIINAVNFIFRQIMTPLAGEMAYTEKAQLVCGAAYPQPPSGAALVAGPVELHLLEPGDTADDSEDLSNVEREARVVAGRIREMLASGALVWEGGRWRPLTWRDLVVLLRSVRGSADTFVYEFRRQGIPATADAGPGYFDATEVETMLSVLQVIDNPLQDIPLAACLRSPLVGLSATELGQIRAAHPDEEFHRAVAASLDNAKLNSFFALLEQWRTHSREGRLSDLIWRIYRDTGFYDYVGGLPGGQTRQANLRSLYDRACEYEKTSFSGLFDFLGFVQRLREGGRDTGPSGAVADKEDVVRIMSIHKSKGLEFPVVFLAGLGRSFNMQDVRGQTVLHKDLGIGPDVVDRDMGVRYPSWAKLAIRERLGRDSLAEEMRILYVALTRAREKLVLVGSVRNLTARLKEWGTYADWPQVPLPDGRLLAAASCLDWIGPAVLRHRDAAAWSPVGAVIPPEVRDDPSIWTVHCWESLPALPEMENGPVDEVLFEQVRRGEPLAVPPAVEAQVAARLDWTYPHQVTVGRSAKIGVTGLKMPFEPVDEEAQFVGPVDQYPPHPTAVIRPRFLQETMRLSELERGSAWHLVLQHLDLAGDLSIAGIVEQIRGMRERLLLSEQLAGVVEPALIARIFSQPLGQRICRGVARRELPFSLLLPAGEVYPDLSGRDETVLVQGVIDCLVEEGDGFLLVDWKTDRVFGAVQAAERYRRQLDIYALAVRTILRRPVREKYLYFLQGGEAVLLD